MALSLLLSEWTAQRGLNIVLSAGVLTLSGGLVLLMCALAALGSVRAMLRVDCGSVFR
jgi:hypothetical protein